MAKNSISDYDTTAANNTDIQSTDISEGCAASGINNAIREMMADTADAFTQGTPIALDQTNNRVGIGTTSPQQLLQVSANNPGGKIRLEMSQTGVANNDVTGEIQFYHNDASGAGVNADIKGICTSGVGAGALTFGTGTTSTTERMRIVGSTVCVGTTDINLHNSNTAGVNLGGNGNDGQIIASCDGNRPLILHRASSDGQIIEFGCQTSTTGEIGSRGGNVYIVGSNAGIKFGNNSAFVPTDSSGNNSDNARDVGSSSVRFDDIFATNSSIQTSDQNEKEQIASLTTVEITAAKAISKLFKTFKWQDKVAAKGDAARKHAGVIAQEVQTAMTDAGLNAAHYAFWCSDTWWEADGEIYETADEAPEGATQRTRLGIRYPELLAFIGAATEQRLADIETRLTALEDA